MDFSNVASWTAFRRPAESRWRGLDGGLVCGGGSLSGKMTNHELAGEDRSALAPLLQLPGRAIPRRRQRQRLQSHAGPADPRDRLGRDHAGFLLEPRHRILSDSLPALLADRRLLRRPLREAPRAVLDQGSG